MQKCQVMPNNILVAGLIAVGGFVVALALILGLKFPQYVFTKNIEDLCVVSRDHVKFGIWVR